MIHPYIRLKLLTHQSKPFYYVKRLLWAKYHNLPGKAALKQTYFSLTVQLDSGNGRFWQEVREREPRIFISLTYLPQVHGLARLCVFLKEALPDGMSILQ